jgi:hypothetical protein
MVLFRYNLLQPIPLVAAAGWGIFFIIGHAVQISRMYVCGFMRDTESAREQEQERDGGRKRERERERERARERERERERARERESKGGREREREHARHVRTTSCNINTPHPLTCIHR